MSTPNYSLCSGLNSVASDMDSDVIPSAADIQLALFLCNHVLHRDVHKNRPLILCCVNLFHRFVNYFCKIQLIINFPFTPISFIDLYTWGSTTKILSVCFVTICHTLLFLLNLIILSILLEVWSCDEPYCAGSWYTIKLFALQTSYVSKKFSFSAVKKFII
jgi:hypothetical protein